MGDNDDPEPEMGDDNTLVGNVDYRRMGSGNTIVGGTEGTNTFVRQPGTAIGAGAEAGPHGIAIGARARGAPSLPTPDAVDRLLSALLESTDLDDGQKAQAHHHAELARAELGTEKPRRDVLVPAITTLNALAALVTTLTGTHPILPMHF